MEEEMETTNIVKKAAKQSKLQLSSMSEKNNRV
jgi:hypothetical protein